MNSKKCVCLDCKKEFNIQMQCLKKRHFRSGEPICKKCYLKISRGGRYLDCHPKELDSVWNNEILEYDVVKPFLSELKTKKKVRFTCQECSKKDIMQIKYMKRRKICGCKPICRKCALKFATNSDEWRKSNSEAQYISQNNPIVLKKQRSAQLRLMKNDPLYAEKRCSKSYISGRIKGFRFDSSWELYFIVYCWVSKDISSIERYGGSITYTDSSGKKRKYYPDFIVQYKNKNKKIIEIKGSKKYNNFHEKFNAARKKHGMNYLVYEEKDLIAMGIKFRTESYLKNFYKKHNKDIVFYDNEKTKLLKGRIKSWLRLNP